MPDSVLVLGGDVNAFLAVVRSLGRLGLEVHVAELDITPAALSSRYVHAHHRLPPYADDPGRWVEALRQIVDEHRIRMILPTSDSSMVKLQRHGHWPGGPLIATPNAAAFEVFTDKLATRSLAVRCGVPVATRLQLAPNTSFEGLAEGLVFPLVLKPESSYRLGDSSEKRYAQIFRNSEELLRSEIVDDLSGWFAETFFVGEGVGVSVLAKDGSVLRAYQHRRLAQESDTGPSCSRVSEAVSPHLLRHVSAMAQATLLTGVAMFEFRVDRSTGAHILLEVNPRFWGSLPLALAAGADFPAWLYDLLTSGTGPAPGSYAVGHTKRNVLGEYSRLVRAVEEGSYASAFPAALDAAFHLFLPRSWDSWAPDDPAPFVEERKELARRLLAGIWHRFRRHKSLPLRYHSA